MFHGWTPSLSGPCFRAAVPVACLWLSLWSGPGRFWVGVCRPRSCPLYRSVSVGSNSKKKRAPTPEPAVIQRSLFDRHPLLFRCSGSSVPCIRSHASAGHLVVYFVTAPRGDNTGGRFSTSSANHLVSVPPTGSEPRDGFSFRFVLDFGSLYQRRCGVVSNALSRQPSSSSTSLRRLRLCVAAQASGSSLSDVSAVPDVTASRISRRRATATSTPLTRRGAAAISTPL